MNVYFDNAATTKMSQVALDAMIPCLENVYANASSLHTPGQKSKEVLEKAREEIAACIGAQPNEIYFTSGGSEADNQAIVSAAKWGARRNKKHIISTAFEHHAVLHTLQKLEKEGYEVTYLDVHENGMVRLDELEAAIRPDTCLVTVMYANNEIGSIQPIAEIGAICKENSTDQKELVFCMQEKESCFPTSSKVVPRSVENVPAQRTFLLSLVWQQH